MSFEKSTIQSGRSRHRVYDVQFRRAPNTKFELNNPIFYVHSIFTLFINFLSYLSKMRLEGVLLKKTVTLNRSVQEKKKGYFYKSNSKIYFHHKPLFMHDKE